MVHLTFIATTANAYLSFVGERGIPTVCWRGVIARLVRTTVGEAKYNCRAQIGEGLSCLFRGQCCPSAVPVGPGGAWPASPTIPVTFMIITHIALAAAAGPAEAATAASVPRTISKSRTSLNT